MSANRIYMFYFCLACKLVINNSYKIGFDFTVLMKTAISVSNFYEQQSQSIVFYGKFDRIILWDGNLSSSAAKRRAFPDRS